MKVKCRKCDICGSEINNYDCQFWVRPKILRGVPSLGMKRMDICCDCFSKLEVYIQHPELIKSGRIVMWYGGICRETGKFCQYATQNGYCQMTVCINHPSIEIITYPWMVEKPKEDVC